MILLFFFLHFSSTVYKPENHGVIHILSDNFVHNFDFVQVKLRF